MFKKSQLHKYYLLVILLAIFLFIGSSTITGKSNLDGFVSKFLDRTIMLFASAEENGGVIEPKEPQKTITIEGNTVYKENSYGKIVVYPHTDKELIDHVQYLNLTWKLAETELDFAFQLTPENNEKWTGKSVSVWRNYSHPNEEPIYGNVTKHRDCPGTYNVDYGLINDSWGWCNESYIDPNNETKYYYWEHYFDSYKANASGIRIFWNETEIVDWTDKWYFDYQDISSQFNKEERDNNHYYFIKNVNFKQDETKQVKIQYTTPPNTEGKWSMFVKRSSDTIQEALDSGNYVKLDPWWDANFLKCRNITIVKMHDVDLEDYPAYINVTYDSDMQEDYDDLRFINETCGSVTAGRTLSYEVENYTEESAHVWVKVNLTSRRTNISVYYGDDDASDGQNAEDVWSEDYVMVQHLQETDIDGGSGDIKDSTSNDNDGTTADMNTADQVAGKVDGSFDFDGTNDYIYKSNPSFIDDTQGTVEVWVRFTDLTQSHAVVNVNVDGATDDEYLFMYYRGTDDNYKVTIYMMVNGGTSLYCNIGTNAITDTNWHHWVVTSDASTIRTYLDGQEKTLSCTAGSNTGQWMSATPDADVFVIGALKRASPVIDTEAQVDELHISNTARSGHWLNQSYLMVNNQSNANFPFVIFSDETGDTTVPIINCSFNVSIDSIYQNTVLNFSCNATDNVELSTLNMTWNYTTGIVYSNYTVTTPAYIDNVTTITDVGGNVINFTGYATDTSGNVKQNSTKFTITTVDTCSCPASGDWIIDCSDNCVITSDCDMQGNDIHTYGDGTIEVNALIYNFKNFFNRCDLFCRNTPTCFG